MRLLLRSHIQNARQSLKSSRLRTTLTMLGVAIGVASVTAILSLGAGASKIVSNQVDELGGNIAVVRPTSSSVDPLTNVTKLQSSTSFTASSLTAADVARLQQIPNVESVAPLMFLTGAISGTSTAPDGTSIVATTPEFADITHLDIREGQFLDPNIKQNTVVVGVQLSINIFGTEHSLGRTMMIRGQPFTIIGILERTNEPINYNGVDLDNAVIINEASAREFNQGNLQIQQINIKSDSVNNLQTVVATANRTLLEAHFNQADFSILTGDKIAQPTSQLFYSIAGVTTAIAAISLIVGGIGIMNIMLVSVAERTREIGIRKALGASNGDIVWQFLIEALALSIGGGIMGYIAGYIIAFTISTFLTFDPIFSWQIAAVAAGVSLIIGTLFGLYPAIRAARKDPISALRQYD